MRIDSLEIYHVAMPLLNPWRTAYGEDHVIHSILVKARSGDYSSWSESTPLYAPTYLTESAGAVFYNISEFFAPHVVGKEFSSAKDINNHLGIFKGNSFGKAAVEIVWWTLESAITGIPLHLLLGGKTREVQAGADFGIQDSIDTLLGHIQEAVNEGFPRIKLKVKKGWDLDVLRVVYSTFPDTIFHIDCNSGYSLDDLPFFKAIDKFGLAFIEQPLHFADLLDHAQLARQIETPLCLDESIVSVESAKQSIQVEACQYINIKPGRVGGLSNAIAIHDLARDAGIPVWIGGMLESGLGHAICVELATLDNFSYPGDLFPSTQYYEKDLCQPPAVLTPRLTFKPHMEGLPVPDPAYLDTQTVGYKLITS